MSPIARRALLIALLPAPLFLFADATTHWANILASPFESWWVAGFVALMGYFAYAFAGSSKVVTARGLMMAWGFILFISFVSWSGASLSDDDYSQPPQRVQGALSNADRAVRNYVWYMAAIGVGVVIAVRRGRAKWHV